MKHDHVKLSRWCIMVHKKKLWTIMLVIGTKQEWIPFLATATAYIQNHARKFITFFNIPSFTAHIQRFWNAYNKYCRLHENIYLSEVSTFSYLENNWKKGREEPGRLEENFWGWFLNFFISSMQLYQHYLHISSFSIVYIDIWHIISVCYALMISGPPKKYTFGYWKNISSYSFWPRRLKQI